MYTFPCTLFYMLYQGYILEDDTSGEGLWANSGRAWALNHSIQLLVGQVNECAHSAKGWYTISSCIRFHPITGLDLSLNGHEGVADWPSVRFQPRDRNYSAFVLNFSQ